MPHIDNLQPRAAECAALARRQVEILTEALGACWWWQGARKMALRERRAARVRELLDCYDLPPGGIVEVPTEWIR